MGGGVIRSDKPRAAPTRPSDQLIGCLCDWQDGWCHYQPRPVNCRGPHISEKPPTRLERLWRAWRRLMTDEEGV